jgi:hypothetical protein
MNQWNITQMHQIMPLPSITAIIQEGIISLFDDGQLHSLSSATFWQIVWTTKNLHTILHP